MPIFRTAVVAIAGLLAAGDRNAVERETVSFAQSQLIDVFTRGEGGYFCIKIPAVVALASGTLLAFAEGRMNSCSDFTWTDIVLKRSLDGGLTWSPLRVVYSNSTNETAPVVIGNAAPVQDRATGWVVMPFCRNNLQVLITHSEDDGVTWAPPANLSGVTDPSWTWVGTGPPASLQLASGRIVTPAYHSTTPHDDGEVSTAHAMWSDDGGQTWALGGSWTDGVNFPNENQLVELPPAGDADGATPVLWSNARGLLRSRVGAVSADGGVSWRDAAPIPGLTQPLQGCEGSTLLHPGAGRLFFSGPADPSFLRYNLSLWSLPATSAAPNASWAYLGTVFAGSAAYSSLAVLPAASPLSGAPLADLGLLFDRANKTRVVFDPDYISFVRISITAAGASSG